MVDGETGPRLRKNRVTVEVLDVLIYNCEEEYKEGGREGKRRGSE